MTAEEGCRNIAERQAVQRDLDRQEQRTAAKVSESLNDCSLCAGGDSGCPACGGDGEQVLTEESDDVLCETCGAKLCCHFPDEVEPTLYLNPEVHSNN